MATENRRGKSDISPQTQEELPAQGIGKLTQLDRVSLDRGTPSGLKGPFSRPTQPQGPFALPAADAGDAIANLPPAVHAFPEPIASAGAVSSTEQRVLPSEAVSPLVSQHSDIAASASKFDTAPSIVDVSDATLDPGAATKPETTVVARNFADETTITKTTYSSAAQAQEKTVDASTEVLNTAAYVEKLKAKLAKQTEVITLPDLEKRTTAEVMTEVVDALFRNVTPEGISITPRTEQKYRILFGLAHTPLQPDATIMDIGSGNAIINEEKLGLQPGNFIKTDLFPVEGVAFANVTQLTYPDNSVNEAWASFSLRHLDHFLPTSVITRLEQVSESSGTKMPLTDLIRNFNTFLGLKGILEMLRVSRDRVRIASFVEDMNSSSAVQLLLKGLRKKLPGITFVPNAVPEYKDAKQPVMNLFLEKDAEYDQSKADAFIEAEFKRLIPQEVTNALRRLDQAKVEEKTPDYEYLRAYSEEQVPGYSIMISHERGLQDYLAAFDQKVEDLRGRRVLDIGSGMRLRFAKEAKELGITVVSLNPQLRYDHARRLSRIPLPGSSLEEIIKRTFMLNKQEPAVAAIGQIMPFTDEAFDETFDLLSATQFSTKDIESYQRYFSEQQRILAPGGHMNILYWPDIYSLPLVKAQIARLQTEGYEVRQREEVFEEIDAITLKITKPTHSLNTADNEVALPVQITDAPQSRLEKVCYPEYSIFDMVQEKNKELKKNMSKVVIPVLYVINLKEPRTLWEPKGMYTNPDAQLRYFEPVDTNAPVKRDRFGNRVISSQTKAYKDRDNQETKAAMLVSIEGERFITANPGILSAIDRGLQQLTDITRIDLGNNIRMTKLPYKGQQSITYLLKVDSEKYIIKQHTSQKNYYSDTKQPYFNEMLQTQAVAAAPDFKDKLTEAGIEMATFLFASGQMSCVKFEEGTHPTWRIMAKALKGITPFMESYIRKLSAQSTLWNNIKLDPTPDNFIKRADGTLVWIDPFSYDTMYDLENFMIVE